MRVLTTLLCVNITPFGSHVDPLVYLMMAVEDAVGGTGSASTSAMLLLAVFLPREIRSQKETRRTSSRKPFVLVTGN